MSGRKFAKTFKTQNTKNCIQTVSKVHTGTMQAVKQYKAELYHHGISKISEKK